MRMRILPVALALSTCLAGVAAAWRTDVTGTPSPSRPNDVATLSDGTVVAAGRISDGIQEDALVVSLEAETGAERWRHVVPGGDPTGNDLYRRVIPGPGGTVIAAGRVFGDGTNTDALVSVLDDADGSVVWETTRDGGEGLTDDVQDVTVVAGGDVLAVGRLEAGQDFGSFAVWRLEAANGAILWTTHLDAPSGIGRRIVTSGDFAYVIGETDATGTDDDVLVARIALADGAVDWTTTLGGDAGLDDDAVAIAFSGGRVLALATAFDLATGPDGLLVSLSAGSGNEVWRHTFDGSATDSDDDDSMSALALAPNGDPIVAGSVSNLGSAGDVLVARLLASDGSLLWRTERDGGNLNNDEARGLVVASLGTADGAFVTGRLREPNVRGEIAGIRLDASTGVIVWQRAIEGGDDRNDVGLAIAADANGDVVIGGRARRDATGDEFAVIKLSGASGGSYPCGNGQPDPGEGCDDGNAVRGDGCRPDCTVEACGDAIVDPGEDCDDLADPCCAGDCTYAPADTTCDDGDLCTRIDTCVAGTCTGMDPVVCPPSGQCDIIACDPALGTCVTTFRPDATTCSDGDACTRNDQCRAGECMAGVAEICDDFDPCTLDACESATGCTFTAFEGIASVSCALDPARVDRQCGTSVPRTIERRIAKMGRLLAKAESTERIGRTKRFLRRIARTAKGAARKTTRLRNRSRLPFTCADGLIDIFAAVEARALAERDTL